MITQLNNVTSKVHVHVQFYVNSDRNSHLLEIVLVQIEVNLVYEDNYGVQHHLIILRNHFPI